MDSVFPRYKLMRNTFPAAAYLSLSYRKIKRMVYWTSVYPCPDQPVVNIFLPSLCFLCPSISTFLLSHLKVSCRASLVAQWLGVLLPMQGTWVRALVQEDPTCRGATGPVCHSCWACALEPVCHNGWNPRAWSACSTTGEGTAVRSLRAAAGSGPRSPRLGKAHTQQQGPNTAKTK